MRKTGSAIWVLCVLAAAALYVFAGTDAAAFLLAASIVLPPTQMLLPRIAADRVSAELTMPAIIQKGKTVTGRLIIHNRSIIPIVNAHTDIEVVNLLTRERRVFELSCPVMPRASVELPFVFESAYCGQLVFSRNGISVCDSLGLYFPKSREPAAEPFHKIVVPELFSSNVRLSSSEVSAKDEATRYLDKKGKDRTEVFQLRDYAEGDTQNQIRWKLTAKYGKLIVSDASEPIEHSLLIFWDGAGIPEDAPPSVPDALAEALVTICVALTERGIPFSLAWRSGKTGRTEVKDITGLDDIYDTVPELLSPSAGDGVMFDGIGNWPRVAYFSGRILPEADELQAYVSGFVCIQGSDGLFDTDGAVVVFSPDNYQSTLSNVII